MTTELYAAVEMSRRPGDRLIEDVRLHPTSERASWDADQAAEQHIVVSVHKVALPDVPSEPAVALPNEQEAAFVRWLNAHGGKLRTLRRVAGCLEEAVGEDRYGTARADLLPHFYALHSMMPQLYAAILAWPQTPEAAARAGQGFPF